MQTPPTPLSFIVPPFIPGRRLDIFLTDSLKNTEDGQRLSRERVKKAILEGRVNLNGQACLSPKQLLKSGDEVLLTLANTSNLLTPEPGELNVLAELGDVLVLNKTPDLTVHPCDSQPEGTLVQRLLATYPRLAGMDGPRPGIVHRLDKDTSGLLLVALSEPVRLALSRDFAERKVHKTYLALVRGVPKQDEGTIDAPIGRHPGIKTRMAVVPENKGGKPALTRWKKIWAESVVSGATPDMADMADTAGAATTTYGEPGGNSPRNSAKKAAQSSARNFAVPARGRFSLLEIEIVTGRTHQVRVHMSHIGHPLLGDKVYGPQPAVDCPAPRQMLHAWRLDFTHPQDNKEYTFIAPPPEDFVSAALDCAEHPLRLILTGSAGCGKSTVLKLLRERGLPCWSADAVVSKLYEPGRDGWSLLDQRFAGQKNDHGGTPSGTPRLGGRFTPRDHNDRPLPVDKRALFAALKENPGLKRDIEDLIHPLVKHDLDQFWRDNERGRPFSQVPALVAEIPLFFESWALFGGKQQAAQATGQITFDQMNPGQANPGRATPETTGLGKQTTDRCQLPELYVVTVSCPQNIREQRLKARGLSDEDIAALSAWQWPEEKKIQRSQAVLDNSGTLEELGEKIGQLLDHIKNMLSAKRAALKKIISREC